MMCCENSEEEKYENGEEENKQESKNPDDDERRVDPGTARNTEEPRGTPLMQLVEHSFFHLRRMGRVIEPRLPDRLMKLLTRTMAKG